MDTYTNSDRNKVLYMDSETVFGPKIHIISFHFFQELFEATHICIAQEDLSGKVISKLKHQGQELGCTENSRWQRPWFQEEGKWIC